MKFGIGWLLDKVSEEVPDAVASCIDCNKLSCGGEELENCAIRLDRQATLKAMRETKLIPKST
jgi:hypothetical protein